MMSAKNAVFYYHPDAYWASREQIKGRHAAGAGFLEGFVRHSEVDAFYSLVSAKHEGTLSEQLRSFDRQSRPLHRLSPASPQFSEVGTLFVPGPDLAERAWQRRQHGDAAYSLCGITHTLSSERIVRILQNNLIAPSCDWDALICTSIAAKEVVERMLGEHCAYLEERFVSAVKPQFQLPVIPLGVDCAHYAELGQSSAREALRQQLGIAEHHVAFMFAGRLSFHSKAHPLPMLIAAEQAQSQCPETPIHMLLAGQFFNDSLRREFERAIAMHPSIKVHIVDGADNEAMVAPWAAADVFVSLSDNIQETFGLTPIEAMAAGLPCLVSDWNGYRDTVSEDCGIRVPTKIPSGKMTEQLAQRYALGLESYDRYIGAVAMMTEVDVAATATAMQSLASAPELRQKMGAAGRQRAREYYDWSVVIKSYQQLWGELQQRRQRGQEGTQRLQRGSPLFPSPLAVFAGHASEVVDESNRVRRTGSLEQLVLLREGTLTTFADQHFLPAEELKILFSQIPESSTAISDVLGDSIGPQRQSRLRALLWLAKFGLVSLN